MSNRHDFIAVFSAVSGESIPILIICLPVDSPQGLSVFVETEIRLISCVPEGLSFSLGGKAQRSKKQETRSSNSRPTPSYSIQMPYLQRKLLTFCIPDPRVSSNFVWWFINSEVIVKEDDIDHVSCLPSGLLWVMKLSVSRVIAKTVVCFRRIRRRKRRL